MREPEIVFFPLSLKMTRKTAIINDKFNNPPLFTSMCIHEHRVGNACWLWGGVLLWLPQVLEMLCIGQKIRQDLEYRNLYVRGACLHHKAAALLLPRRDYALAFLEKGSLLSRCEN